MTEERGIMAEQWQVQYFLMKEKIKQFKGQQRVMEVRALMDEIRYHPLLRSAGSTLRTETRDSSGGFSSKGGKWVKGKGGKFVGSTGGNGSTAKTGLTKKKKSSTLKISNREYDILSKLIDSQFYMYEHEKHGFISSDVLNARYEFDVIRLGEYIILDKKPIKPKIR